MIKKLQALKAKKGFTLVELVVVIAIIGVLAAILVPTLLGYVTSSRVTSANSTASSLKSSINTFITTMDGLNAGIKRVSDVATWGIAVNNAGMVKVSFTGATTAPSAEGGSSSTTTILSNAANNYSYTPTSGKTTSSQGFAARLEDMIANDYGFKGAYVVAYIKNGTCFGVAYYAGSESVTVPEAADFEKGTFAWQNQSSEGINSSGEIIGTSPALTYAGTSSGT